MRDTEFRALVWQVTLTAIAAFWTAMLAPFWWPWIVWLIRG